MASINYVEIAQDAKAAIADAGRVLTLRRAGSSAVIDWVTGEGAAANGPTEFEFRGVVLPTMPLWANARGQQLQEAGDQFVLMEAGVIEPIRTDSVVIDGQSFGIVDIERLAPAGIPVLYTLHLRP